jgi:hypothetical protein
MQVLCRSAKGNAEFHCCVCGQGFVFFWERQSRVERAEALREIQETLRRHHLMAPGQEAHPKDSFLVPEWKDPIAFSGPAIPDDVPAWEL